jgi:NAD(P)-dependent dehydrogenase (short-subunit alcohol dehydrogenase family)
MRRLEGKVAVISNVTTAQGRAQARMFAEEGARVVAAGTDDALGKALVEEIETAGGAAAYVHLNVDDERDWAALVEQASDAFGPVDILVNNAIGSTAGPMVDTELSEWEASLGTGARGSFLGIRAVLPRMLKSGSGAIVNVTSVAAMAPPRGISEAHASVSGALRILTKDVSADYAADGIRCNTVHAGLIEGELLGTGTQAADWIAADIIGVTPMRRQGMHDEVARGVLFLASDDASFITGTELVIDGGYVGF